MATICSNLPLSGGLSRMSEDDFYEASTPRPGKSPRSGKQPVVHKRPYHIKKTPVNDIVQAWIQTHHQVARALKDLETKTNGLPIDDAQLLAETLRQKTVRITVEPNADPQRFQQILPDLNTDIVSVQNQIWAESDSNKRSFLQRKIAFLQNSRKPTNPHYASIHPSSEKLFRDVLNSSTVTRTFPSTTLLISHMIEDTVEFLTAPEKLENRQRVVQQIKDSIASRH
jgi:hypothetical protein